MKFELQAVGTAQYEDKVEDLEDNISQTVTVNMSYSTIERQGRALIV